MIGLSARIDGTMLLGSPLIYGGESNHVRGMRGEAVEVDDICLHFVKLDFARVKFRSKDICSLTEPVTV